MDKPSNLPKSIGQEKVEKYFRKEEENNILFLPSLNMDKLANYYNQQPFNENVCFFISRIIMKLFDHDNTEANTISDFTNLKYIKYTGQFLNEMKKLEKRNVIPNNFLSRYASFEDIQHLMFEINPLRKFIPNFTYVFGGNELRGFTFMESGMYEFPVTEIFKERDRQKVGEIIAQMMGSLNLLMRETKTIIKNEIGDYFRVRTLEKEIVISYPGNIFKGKKYYVKTRYLLVIIPGFAKKWGKQEDWGQEDYIIWEQERKNDIRMIQEAVLEIYSNSTIPFTVSKNAEGLESVLPLDFIYEEPPKGFDIWDCDDSICVKGESLELLANPDEIKFEDYIDVYDYKDSISDKVLMNIDLDMCSFSLSYFLREINGEEIIYGNEYKEIYKNVLISLVEKYQSMGANYITQRIKEHISFYFG